MDREELLNELLDYLDHTGNYYNFLNWEEERGYEITEIEETIEEVREL